MKAYIRKLNRLSDRFYVILGDPENHANNQVVNEDFYTRRMAERYIKRQGYTLVKRKPRTKAA